MKRIVATLLAVLLLSHVTFASDIDLKGLSTDELIELRRAISQELVDRGEFKTATVPAGEYTIGTDIPAGDYSISTDAVMATVTVNSYEQLYVISPSDGVGKMTVIDGDTFATSTTIVLEQYSGLTFE